MKGSGRESRHEGNFLKVSKEKVRHPDPEVVPGP